MADLLFLATTVAFFALTVAVVRLCDAIIGPDSEHLDAAPPDDLGATVPSEAGR